MRALPTNAGEADRHTPPGRLLVMGEVSRLPAGAMVLHDGEPSVVVDDGLRAWSPHGYGPVVPASEGELPVITPTITARIIAAGYPRMLRLAD